MARLALHVVPDSTEHVIILSKRWVADILKETRQWPRTRADGLQDDILVAPQGWTYALRLETDNLCEVFFAATAAQKLHRP